MTRPTDLLLGPPQRPRDVRAAGAMTPPFLLPHVRLELLLRSILTTRWDAAAWAIIRQEVPQLLAMRRQAARDGW